MAKKLPPVHPGEILREEFLVPLKLTPYAVAAALDVAMGRKRGREVQLIAAGAVVVAAVGRIVLSGAPLEFALRDFTGLLLIAVAISVSSTRLR